MAASLKQKKTVGRGKSFHFPDARKLSSWNESDWFWGLILFLAVVATYQPVWYAGFIWDDDNHITANPCIIGPLGLREIWTTSASQFFPLVLTVFWFEHWLWGLNPLPFHLVNVGQQAIDAVLLWRVLRSLKVKAAWLGAAIWGLHPVQVESVAWVAEMKNTQSGLFFLLTTFFFIRWLKRPSQDEPGRSNLDYASALVCAILAMLSKTTTVILPVILCLCAWWLEGRWRWQSLLRIGPIFVLSALASVWSIWSQRLLMMNGMGSHWAPTWPERWVTAGGVIWFYLGKLLWPHPIISIYPRWAVRPGEWMSYLPLLMAGLTWLVLWRHRKTWARSTFFAWSYFLVALIPVLGFFDQPYWLFSAVADHFQYLASMGPCSLAGAGLNWLAQRGLPVKIWLRSVLGAVLLLALGITSWQRAWVYQGEETLWTDSLAKNPTSWVAYNNLGLALADSGRFDEAIAQYRKALEINPKLSECHGDLANSLARTGRLDEAIAEYRTALAITPGSAELESDLGNVLAGQGKVDQAIGEYEQALRNNPNSAEIENNLGNALTREGRFAEAVAQFRKALAVRPDFGDAHDNLGSALINLGLKDEAELEFRKALAINPNNATAHNNLGTVMAQEGRLDAAVAEFEMALQLDPNYAPAQRNLARARGIAGREVPAK